jgi:hypothetical protein
MCYAPAAIRVADTLLKAIDGGLMNHPLQCRCGTLKGFVENPESGNRVICYCKDCQAFAYFLGRANDVLDERGGSDVIQILPKNITFTQGMEALACMRLTEKGLLRWYAGCCNSPIGNTLATPRMSFIGLLHSCVETADEPLDDAFGAVRGWVNTKSAKGSPKPRQVVGPTIGWFFTKVLRARFNGDYKQTPFFRAETGIPVVSPRVLSREEHASVMNAVRAATG